MPVTVRKSRRQSGGFDIVEISTRRVIGHSRSRRKARISAAIRNRALKSRRHG